MKKKSPIADDLALYFPSERLKTRPIDLHAFSSDAGFYSLVPQAVIFPAADYEVRLLLQLAKKHGTSLTFRTAGTSLSGQAVTSSLLVDLSRNWSRVKVEEQGAAVRVQPGVTGNVVNHALRPYGRKIGPDPASINAAMMGGILSNNSSGMCCGVSDNSYHTLRFIKFILPNGILFDTEDPEEYRRFEMEYAHLSDGILDLKRRILTDPELTAKIRHKYKLKNTVGYGLNAFVDFDHPLDILAHLIIGAEGTLAFIAEAVLNTIPDKPFKSSALLFFDSPRTACEAIPLLKSSGAAALEFMDRAALHSIEHLPIAPSFIKTLSPNVSGILCEYQEETALALDERLAAAALSMETLSFVHKTAFTTDESLRAVYWKLRKGLYPSVAALRERGTSVMLEDVAVPVDRLGEAIEALQELFLQFNYHNAIVFGHAKEGNLHFLVSQSIATDEDIAVFGAFNDALAQLVINRFGGSMKAEHGTGRQVAPYVQAEWGGAAYEIMKALKRLIDPDNLLNPGVILNEDKNCHLRYLKSLPVVEEEVDKCVECGYCEHSCPSRNYTLTPRQRIVLRRSLARLEVAGDFETHASILEDYQHDGMDTCAVDGMCATDCPVNINTGELIKRLRRENHSPRANALALKVADHFKAVEGLIKTGLRFGGFVNAVLGNRAMLRMTKMIRKILPSFPLWMSQLTGPLPVRPNQPAAPGAVYFVSCISRMMGKDMEKKDSIVEVFLRLSARAGMELLIPSDIGGTCCGQAFSSKGFVPAYTLTVNRTIEKLWEWSRWGSLPVVMDISSCTHSLQGCRPYLTPGNQERYDRMRIFDSLEYLTEILLPRLTIKRKLRSAVFHPVCSLHKMGLYSNLLELAARTTEEPVIPFAAGCCGMAGDRGFYYPGLITSATRDQGAEAQAANAVEYYSTGKTCEMAMSEAAGQNYRSIVYLLDEVTAD